MPTADDSNELYLGKAKIAELVAECERDGREYEVCEVTPQPKCLRITHK